MSTSHVVEQCASHDPAGREQAVRVMHLINGEHYAGAERVQDLLALRLPALGYEVTLACLKPGRFAEVRRSVEAPLYELPMRRRLDLRPAWSLAMLLRDKGYSLLHTHTARGAVIGALAGWLARVPLVHHVHSPAAADTTHRWRNRLNTLVERRTLGRASALIAVSEAMAAYTVGQGFAEEKVTVVPNGVPVVGPLPRREEPSGTWTLGTMALFRPRKGLEVLLATLAILRRKGLPVRLRAIGSFESPDYEATIRRLADSLGLTGAVEWLGFATDVNRELARMDLFVLPSLFGEGLPMVILEAMAAGVPVIATRVEGAPEAIRDRIDGMIAAPGDADDLARAVTRVLNGAASWSAMRSSAHHRQAARFSDRSMAEGVARVYQRVLATTNHNIKPRPLVAPR